MCQTVQPSDEISPAPLDGAAAVKENQQVPEFLVTAVKEHHYERSISAKTAGEARSRMTELIEDVRIDPVETVISELEAKLVGGTVVS